MVLTLANAFIIIYIYINVIFVAQTLQDLDAVLISSDEEDAPIASEQIDIGRIVEALRMYHDQCFGSYSTSVFIYGCFVQ